MTCKEFIDILQRYPKDASVVVEIYDMTEDKVCYIEESNIVCIG